VGQEWKMKRGLTASAALISFQVGAIGLTTQAVAASRPTVVFLGAADIDLGNVNDGLGTAVCPFPVDVVFHIERSAHELDFDAQGVAYAAIGAAGFRATITNLDTGRA
jgi:hypothetical protein